MRPPNGQTKAQFVASRAASDLSPKSGGHYVRICVGGAMLVIGLGVIAAKYIVAIVRELGPPVWEKNELILVLALVGGAFAILFTQTFLSCMYVIWPFGRKGGT